jgi:hypothetical protein
MRPADGVALRATPAGAFVSPQATARRFSGSSGSGHDPKSRIIAPSLTVRRSDISSRRLEHVLLTVAGDFAPSRSSHGWRAQSTPAPTGRNIMTNRIGLITKGALLWGLAIGVTACGRQTSDSSERTRDSEQLASSARSSALGATSFPASWW